MNKQLLATLAAAALALPALGAESHEAQKEAGFFDFDFHIDLGSMLAQVSDDLKKIDREKMKIEANKMKIDAEKMRIDMGKMAHDFVVDMEGSMAYMFADRVGRGGKVVKGAPYSADVVSETNQALADGNIISHKSASRVYRDGEGRTRQETYRSDTLRTVYITDPVGGTNYTLIPGSKIAVAVPRIERRVTFSSAEGKEQEGNPKVVVRALEGNDEPGVREEVRVQILRMGDGEPRTVIMPTTPVPPVAPVPPTPPIPPIPPVPPLPGAHTLRFESTAHLGKGTTTSLGSKSFEGVKAEGKSTVWTIAAGQIGNRNPISVTSESWYSPDLQVTVYSRHSDPRTGESVYRLAGIRRGEPDAALFKVPEGYTTKGRGKRSDPPG